MNIFVYYTAAAIAEIAGCFAFWSWLRLGKTVYWILPGTIALLIFPILLTRIEAIFAGRTFAAYGSVYIVASLIWLWLIEGATSRQMGYFRCNYLYSRSYDNFIRTETIV